MFSLCVRNSAKAVTQNARSLPNRDSLWKIPVASFMVCDPPPNNEEIDFPEKRKLRMFDRIPVLQLNIKPPKSMRNPLDYRGPELIHNKLEYGSFGIQAITGGNLRHGHLEMMRLSVNRKMDETRMFAVWRIDQPWKPVCKKGQGHRMGGGKGPINHYVFPVRANRMILEMGGRMEFLEVKKFLVNIAKILPFKARVVTKESFEEEEIEKKYIEENNINPLSFEYLAKNNILGIRTNLSPYDDLWHGKYIYKREE